MTDIELPALASDLNHQGRIHSRRRISWICCPVDGFSRARADVSPVGAVRHPFSLVPYICSGADGGAGKALPRHRNCIRRGCAESAHAHCGRPVGGLPISDLGSS